MNKQPARTLVSMAFLAILLLGSVEVYACSKFDIKCKVKEAADKASDEAKSVGRDVQHASDQASAAALDTEAKANGFAHAAEAETSSKAMGFASYAIRMEQESADISNNEYKSLKAAASKAYASDLAQAKNAYVATQNTLKTMLKDTDSLLSFMKKQCTAGSVLNNFGKITPYGTKLTKLSGDEKQALNRLLRALMRKNPIDAQTASDLKAIGTSIGMITQNGVSLVGNAFQSNWGIYIGPSGSYDGLGGGVAVGFNVDTFPQQNGKFNMAITISGGVSATLGTADAGPAGGLDFGLSWGPGSSQAANGLTYTFSGSAMGFNTGLSWALPTPMISLLTGHPHNINPETLKSAATQQVTAPFTSLCAGPGISAGITIPFEPQDAANGSFSAGYTQVVSKGQF
jgi:hypothetical protein